MTASLATEPAEIRHVLDERATLDTYSPDAWFGRHTLRGVMTAFRGLAGPPAPGVLDLDSVRVRTADGRTLTPGVDYVIDAEWGSLCLPEHATERIDVRVEYRYSLRRLDALCRADDGSVHTVRGVSALTNPHPPRPGDGLRAIAHLLVEPFADHAIRYDIAPAPSVPHSGRLPGAAAMLDDDRRVRLLFLGDSISEGGDASIDAAAFPAVATAQLSDLACDVSVVAVGGSRSTQWLDPDDVERDWNRVLAAAPHVTVIEFLNDAYLEPAEWPVAYAELVRRLAASGSEIVLTTPIFTHRTTMHSTDEQQDGRAYTAFIREFARAHGLPLIDISARWAALHDEGLPYWTLLANGINHPDDRGHALTGTFVAAALRSMLGR